MVDSRLVLLLRSRPFVDEAHFRWRAKHRVLHVLVDHVALLEIEQRTRHQLVLRIVRVATFVVGVDLGGARRSVALHTASALTVHMGKVLRVAAVAAAGARQSIDVILHEVD